MSETVDALEPLVELHQDGNAGRAHETDIGQLEPNVMVTLADGLREVVLQVIGPVTVEPSADPKHDAGGRRDPRNFHALRSRGPTSPGSGRSDLVADRS